MKVFLVIEDFGYEGIEIDSIWDNRLAAKKRKTEIEASDISWEVRIEDWEVQE